MIGLWSMIAVSLLTAQQSEPYVWPLELPRALTSSFGEYRANRFHMGIDLRTGPIGKEVFAAEVGYVSRIRCSPYGYGKVVYLQLDDGNTAVYAHLNDFIPEFRDYVRRAQHDRKKYTVDLYPDPGEFRVKRGQLIAYSGQTGIGVPHLHWEIRDRAGVPTSQRLFGLEWPDKTRPIFRKLLVIPTTPDTTLNGDYFPVVVSARKQRTGEYTVEPIRVKGSIAVGVDVYDSANGGASKLGVHAIETSVGERSVFSMVHDRIGYAHSGDGTVAYHPFFRSRGKFLMQRQWPGVQTELYKTASANGIVPIDEGDQTLQIEAADFYGNDSVLRVPLVHDARRVRAPVQSSDSGSGTVMMDSVGQWLLVTAAFSSAESVLPILLEFGVPSETAIFRRVNDTTFRAAYVPESGVTEIGLSVDHPRAGWDGESDRLIEHRFWIPETGGRAVLGGVALDASNSESYGRVFLTVGTSPTGSASGLTPIGSGFRIWPTEAPFKKPLEITLPWPKSTNPEGSGFGVYRKQGKKWSWIDAKATAEGMRFATKHLGQFQIMADTTAPSLRFRRPASGARVSSTRPDISLSVIERGSGIARWTAEYAGEWMLMAYDPEQNLLFWERDESLPSGPGEFSITVWDEAGNRQQATRSIVVP
ncbi:MAG: M23 family metallopeptidase [Candidatus Hydrogenedentota bacterium]